MSTCANMNLEDAKKWLEKAKTRPISSFTQEELKWYQWLSAYDDRLKQTEKELARTQDKLTDYLYPPGQL